MVRWTPIVMFVLACGLWQCGSGGRSFDKAPVILISIDTLRSDYVGAYGSDLVATPHMDALAADGVLFERAYSHYPLTLPSHAALFTGKITPNIGVRDNIGYHLDEKFETLAETLKDADYATGGVVSGMVLRGGTGIAQGFDSYQDNLNLQSQSQVRLYAQRRGDASVELAKAWLSKNDKGPYFLFLHLYDPHTPYEAPEPFGSKYQHHPYAGEVAYSDHLLGQFLDYLKKRGLYDEAMIVLLSDHGESLGAHGEDEHGIFLYREALQVPMIVKLPQNHRAGSRISAPVGLFDVRPTVLAALGIDDPLSEGQPLLNKKPDPERLLFSETQYPLNSFGWCASRAVIRGDWQYVEICEPELYDLTKDPKQQDNRYGQAPVPKGAVAFLESIGSGLETQSNNSAEELAMLASLGYTGGSVGLDAESVRDPHKEIGIFQTLDRAKVLTEAGDFAGVEALLISAMERNPSFNNGRYLLIRALTEQGKLQAAEHVCLEGLGLFPNDLNYLTSLTSIKLKLNKLEDAKTIGTKAFKSDADISGAQLLIPIYDAGLVDFAVSQSKNILATYGNSALSVPYAHMILGRNFYEKKRYREALTHFEQVTALGNNVRNKRDMALTYRILGDCYGRLNQLDRGLEAVKMAVDMQPNFPDAQVTLAYLYAAKQDPAKVIKTLDSWLTEFPSQDNFLKAAKAVERMGMTTKGKAYRDAAAGLDDGG